jgi:SAM-dependent methyltransferase
MTQEDWFGSPYYKILYQDRDEQEARAFIEQLLDYLQPKCACRVLDIACGDGRHAIQLEGHGFDVTGIDIAHASIERAKASENDNLHFFVQDMRFPFYINYFDFAFNFFTSFGYFRNQRDHLLAAKSFSASLVTGGQLVIDYLNSDYIVKNLVSEASVYRGSYHFNITRRLENKHIVKNIHFKDADNRECHVTETVAAFSLAEFQEMFQAAGMTLTRTFGDYNLSEFDCDVSPRMIMIFNKD